MSKIVVRCTSLEEAFAVCDICEPTISHYSCRHRFDEIFPEYGHLDFVFKGLYPTRWGDYSDLVRYGIADAGLPQVSGWRFVGEDNEVFRSDISLESLLAGGALR